MKRFFIQGFAVVALLVIGMLTTLPALAGGTFGVDHIAGGVWDWITEGRYAGWEITGWVNPDGQEDGFALVSRNGENALLWFRRAGKKWSFVRAITKAVPQGGLPVELFDTSGTSLLDERRLDTAFMMYCNNGEYYERALTFQKVERTWRLVYYAPDGQSRMVAVYDDCLAYDVGEDTFRKVYGTVQTDLRWFSLSALPKTVEAAREKLSSPPSIPEGDLSAKRVKFSGGRKYAVYAGPGTDYLRPANGKAAVSTNDWIQVFGEENGWILIQYDISGDQMRVGWIEAGALPKDASVAPFAFEPVDARITRSVEITDDPLGARGALGVLKDGAEVQWLKRMGDWAYVEAEIDGKPARGFVPMDSVAFEHDAQALVDVG